jgi:hypothetical protein
MSALAAQLSTSTPLRIRDKILLPGIALGSFSALLLELSLTRLFSVVLFYHFAFLAISIALLGLGAGGVIAHLFKPQLDQWSLRRIAATCCILSALLVPLVLEIILHTPVSLELSGSNFARLSVIYLFSSAPFFLTGLEFSVIFAREGARVSSLYCADLAGGALACLALVPLLNRIGGPNAILFAALSSAIAAVVWSSSVKGRRMAAVLAVLLAALTIANYSGKIIDVVWAKGIRRTNVEFARWNAISRVEVDRNRDGSRVIVIDADANTFIMNADPRQFPAEQWQSRLMAAAPAVVNVLRPDGDYAIIGPGGGVDVLRAVANGSHSVTGIEINPIIATTIMRQRYADFAYYLYQRPEVEIHVSDGRSFLRTARTQFDVVQMTLVDTWASTAAGAFALSENNLYTTEAFREYFAHLKPNGMIAVTRWEFQQPREALRVVSVAMEALRRMGIRDAAGHFMVVSEGPLKKDGIPVAVFAKKSAFTTDEEATVAKYVEGHAPLTLQYSPSHPRENAFSALIRSNDPQDFSRGYDYNVTAVTDDAPFFFFTLKPSRILPSISETGAMDWKVNLGVAVLGMVLVISALAVLLFLIGPLLWRRHAARPGAALFYFIAIGLGYIVSEVAFIQRFVLFLGHPTYALTVVVFLMLLASAGGSLLSRLLLVQSASVWIPLLLIVAALLGYVFLLPLLLSRFVGVAFLLKLLISFALLVPLGFVMGMPFPTGLRCLRGNSVEWAWALNASSSVMGSVLAITIAIQFGLNMALACAAAAYALALLLRGKLLAGESAA